MKKFVEEFKAFALRGNVLDMAVGVIIGSAFGKIVSSLVEDLFMPVISLITGGASIAGAFIPLDGQSYASLEAAKEAGAATLNYGAFLQNVIDFIIIALCIFLFVKLATKMMPKKAEAPAKEPRLCPFCKQPIADDAVRCPHCTSQLVVSADQ